MGSALFLVLVLLEGIQLANSKNPQYKIRVKVPIGDLFEVIPDVVAKIKTDTNGSAQLDVRGPNEVNVKAAFEKLQDYNLCTLEIQNVNEPVPDANWQPYPCSNLENKENISTHLITITKAAKAKKYHFFVKSATHRRLRVGSWASNGRKTYMEDRHTHILSIPGHNMSSFFGVYDGHNGAAVAVESRKSLHKYIVDQSEYKKQNVREALKQGFAEFDKEISKVKTMEHEVGTTANVVIIRDNTVYCANLGDSRAVASVAGSAVPLSYDHKPYNVDEYIRIVKAGGKVNERGVEGNLGTARALGDFDFKRTDVKAENRLVSAIPDVTELPVTDDLEFILVACDGIWDVVNNEFALNFVRTRLIRRMKPEIICQELIDHCVAPPERHEGVGQDNMTAILIVYLPASNSYEAFCDALSRRQIGAPPIPVIPANDQTFTFRLLKTQGLGLEHTSQEFKGKIEFHKFYKKEGEAPFVQVEDSESSTLDRVLVYRGVLRIDGPQLTEVLSQIEELAAVNRNHPNREPYSFMEIKLGEDFFNVADIHVNREVDKTITFKSFGRHRYPMVSLVISENKPVEGTTSTDGQIIKAMVVYGKLQNELVKQVQIWEAFPNGVNNPPDMDVENLKSVLETAAKNNRLWMLEPAPEAKVDGKRGKTVVRKGNEWENVNFQYNNGLMNFSFGFKEFTTQIIWFRHPHP